MSDKPLKTNEYPLYPAYKSPLMEFFYQNPDAFLPSLEFRTKTTDFFSKTRDAMDGVMFSKLGLDFEIKKGKFYTSGINILIDRITREVNNSIIGFDATGSHKRKKQGTGGYKRIEAKENFGDREGNRWFS